MRTFPQHHHHHHQQQRQQSPTGKIRSDRSAADTATITTETTASSTSAQASLPSISTSTPTSFAWPSGNSYDIRSKIKTINDKNKNNNNNNIVPERKLAAPSNNPRPKALFVRNKTEEKQTERVVSTPPSTHTPSLYTHAPGPEDEDNDESSSTTSATAKVLREAARHCVRGQELVAMANRSEESSSSSSSSLKSSLLHASIQKYQAALYVLEKTMGCGFADRREYRSLMVVSQIWYWMGLAFRQLASGSSSTSTSTSTSIPHEHRHVSSVDATGETYERHAVQSLVSCLRLRYHLLDRGGEDEAENAENDEIGPKHGTHDSDDVLLTRFVSPLMDIQLALTNLWESSSSPYCNMTGSESARKLQRLRIATWNEDRGDECLFVFALSGSSTLQQQQQQQTLGNNNNNNNNKCYSLDKALTHYRKALETFSDENHRNEILRLKIGSCYRQSGLRTLNSNQCESVATKDLQMAVFWYRSALKSFCGTTRFASKATTGTATGTAIVPATQPPQSEDADATVSSIDMSSTDSLDDDESNEDSMVNHPTYKRIILRIEEILVWKMQQQQKQKQTPQSDGLDLPIVERDTKMRHYLRSKIKESVFYQADAESMLSPTAAWRRRATQMQTQTQTQTQIQPEDGATSVLANAKTRLRASLRTEKLVWGDDHPIVLHIVETIGSIEEEYRKIEEENLNASNATTQRVQSTNTKTKECTESSNFNVKEAPMSPLSCFDEARRPLEYINIISSQTTSNGSEKLPFATRGYVTKFSSSPSSRLTNHNLFPENFTTAISPRNEERFETTMHLMNRCKNLEDELRDANDTIQSYKQQQQRQAAELGDNRDSPKQQQQQQQQQEPQKQKQQHNLLEVRCRELEEELEISQKIWSPNVKQIGSAMDQSSKDQNLLLANRLSRIHEEVKTLRSGKNAFEGAKQRLEDDNKKVLERAKQAESDCIELEHQFTKARDETTRIENENKLLLQRCVQTETLKEALDRARVDLENRKEQMETIELRQGAFQEEKIQREIESQLLLGRCRTAEANLEVSENRCIELESNLERSKEKLGSTKNENNTLRCDLEKHKEELGTIKHQHSVFQEEKARIENESRCQNAEARLEVSENRCIELESNLERSQEELGRTKDENNALRCDIEKHKEELRTIKHQQSVFQDEKARIENESELLLTRCQNAEANCIELESNLEQRKEELGSSKDENDALRKRSSEMETRLQTSLGTSEPERSAPEEHIPEESTNEHQIEQLEEENNRLVDRCTEMENDMDIAKDLSEKLASSLRDEVARVETELKNSKDQCTTLETKLDDWKKTETDEKLLHTTRIAQLERDIEQLSSEGAEIQAKLQQDRAELNDKLKEEQNIASVMAQEHQILVIGLEKAIGMTAEKQDERENRIAELEKELEEVKETGKSEQTIFTSKIVKLEEDLEALAHERLMDVTKQEERANLGRGEGKLEKDVSLLEKEIDVSERVKSIENENLAARIIELEKGIEITEEKMKIENETLRRENIEILEKKKNRVTELEAIVEKGKVEQERIELNLREEMVAREQSENVLSSRIAELEEEKRGTAQEMKEATEAREKETKQTQILRDRVSELQKDIGVLKTDESEHNELQHTISKLEAEVKESNDEKETLSSQLQCIESTHEEKNKEHDRVISRCTELENELRDSKKEAHSGQQEFVQQISDLEDELELSTKKNADISLVIESYEVKLNTKQLIFDKAKEEHRDLLERYSMLEDEAQEFQLKSDKNADNAGQRILTLMRTIDEMRKEDDTSAGEIKRSIESNSELTSQVELLTASFQAEKEEKEKITNAVVQLEQELQLVVEKTKEEQGHLKNRNVELEKELGFAKDEHRIKHTSLTKRIADVEDELETALANNKELSLKMESNVDEQDENEEIRKRCIGLEKDIKTLQERKVTEERALNEINSRLENELKLVSEKNCSDLDDFSLQISTIEKEMATIIELNKNLEVEVETGDAKAKELQLALESSTTENQNFVKQLSALQTELKSIDENDSKNKSLVQEATELLFKLEQDRKKDGGLVDRLSTLENALESSASKNKDLVEERKILELNAKKNAVDRQRFVEQLTTLEDDLESSELKNKELDEYRKILELNAKESTVERQGFIEQLATMKDDIESSKSKNKDLEKQKKNLESTSKKHTAEHQSLMEQLTTLEKSLESLESENKELDEYRKILELNAKESTEERKGFIEQLAALENDLELSESKNKGLEKARKTLEYTTKKHSAERKGFIKYLTTVENALELSESKHDELKEERKKIRILNLGSTLEEKSLSVSSLSSLSSSSSSASSSESSSASSSASSSSESSSSPTSASAPSTADYQSLKEQFTNSENALELSESKRMELEEERKNLESASDENVVERQSLKEKLVSLGNTLESVELKNKELSSEIESFEEERKNLESTAKVHLAEYQGVMEQLATLKNALESAELKNKELSSEIGSFEEERKNLESTANVHLAEYQGVMEQLATLKNALESAELKNKTLSSGIESSDEERKNLESTAKKHAEERQGFVEQLVNLENALESSKLKNKEISSEIESFDEERKNHESSAKKHAEERQGFVDQLVNLENALGSSKLKNKEISSVIESFDEERKNHESSAKKHAIERQGFVDQLVNLENALESSKLRNKEISSEIESFDEERKNHESTVKENAVERQGFLERIAVLQKEIESISVDNDVLSLKIVSLNEIKKENELLSSRASSLEDELKISSEKNTSLSENMESLKNSEVENQDRASRVIELENELQSSKDTNCHLSAEVESLKNQNEDSAQLKNDVSDLEVELESLVETNKTLSTFIESLTAKQEEFHRLADQLSDLETELDSSVASNRNLTAQIEYFKKKEEDHKHVANRLLELESELNTFDTNNQSLANDNKSLHEQEEELIRRISDLELELESSRTLSQTSFKEQEDELIRRISDLETEVESSRTTNQTLIDEAGSLKRQQAEISDKNLSLAADVKSLQEKQAESIHRVLDLEMELETSQATNQALAAEIEESLKVQQEERHHSMDQVSILEKELRDTKDTYKNLTADMESHESQKQEYDRMKSHVSTFAKDIEEANSIMTRQKEDIEAKDEEISCFASQISKLECDLELATETNVRLAEDRKSFESTYNSINDNFTRVKEENTTLHAKCEVHDKELQDFRNGMDRMKVKAEEDKKSLQRQNEADWKEKEDLETQCLELENRLKESLEDNKEITSLLRQKSSQIQSLNQTIDEVEDLDHDYDVMVKQCSELEEELLKTVELNGELTGEMSSLKEEINTLNSNIFDSEIDLNEQEKELQNAEKDKQILENRCSCAERELRDVKDQYEKLAIKIAYPDSVEDGPEWARLQLKELEQRMEDVRKENEYVLKENDILLSRLEEYKKSMERRVEDVKIENEYVIKENDVLLSRLEEYKKSLELQKNLDPTTNNQDLINQCQELEEELLGTVETNGKLEGKIEALNKQIEDWKEYATNTENELEEESEALEEAEKKNEDLLTAMTILDQELQKANEQKGDITSEAGIPEAQQKEQQRITDQCSKLEIDLEMAKNKRDEAKGKVESLTAANENLQTMLEEAVQDIHELEETTEQFNAVMETKNEMKQLLDKALLGKDEINEKYGQCKSELQTTKEHLDVANAEKEELTRNLNIEKQVTLAYKSEDENEFDELYRKAREEVNDIEMLLEDSRACVTDLEENVQILQHQLGAALTFKLQPPKAKPNRKLFGWRGGNRNENKKPDPVAVSNAVEEEAVEDGTEEK